MKAVKSPGPSGGAVAGDSPLPNPIVVYEHCDVDPACDRAKYEVFIGGSDLFKGCRKLYFCGHHFRENEPVFTERKYGVRKL